MSRKHRAGKRQTLVFSEPVGLDLEPISLQPAKNRPNRQVKDDVLTRDKYRCQYCGAYAETVDHVIPRSRGGSNKKKNLVAACGECNHDKADDESIKPRGWKEGKKP